MADPRRLREILGFGYGAPSPAMSALEPFHAGMDPAYMPEDVVTASPTEGPRGWVRSGLESLFGAMAPNERVASQAAEKVTNLSDFVNLPQEAFDIGKGIGDAVQGGDKLSLAMSMIPGKAAEGATKVAKETASTLKDKITDALGGGVIDRTNTGWTFKDYKPIHNEMGKGDWRRADQLDTTEVELPIRSLFASQKTVNPDFADVPNKPIYGPSNPKATPYAIKKNGQYYLQDGHHRLTALADQGKQTAKVRVVDLDEGPPVETPLLDWTPPAPKADDLVPAVKAAQKGIRAYHGTPHDFEKFDLSKIGTGEGAQAYGHGLYFAENEATALDYKKSLATQIDVDGKPILQNNKTIGTTGDRELDDFLIAADGDLDSAIQTAKQYASEDAVWGRAPSDYYNELAGKLEALKGRVNTTNTGHMYEVNINADPDAFLDWDKPLSEQPAWNTISREWGSTPEEAAERIGIDPKTATGRNYIGAVAPQLSGEAFAGVSKRLNEAGIPGIKYLDAGSRTGGEGSRNYVVFSDEIIDIVKKYGIAGALGAGLITQQMADQLEAQQGGGQS